MRQNSGQKLGVEGILRIWMHWLKQISWRGVWTTQAMEVRIIKQVS